MKFTPIFAAGSEQLMEKSLYSSASTKMILTEHDFEPPEVQRQRVTIPTQQLSRELKNYQWRNKTEFPIVRVTTCQVINSNAEKVELEILHESIPVRLEQLGDLPLFKAIYLLKEALIAYERVFNRFGGCRITEKMIGINQLHKCKVWLSENLASNDFTPLPLSQSEFTLQICRILQGKTVASKNAASFYGQLEKCANFSGVLYYIDQYTKENKLALPTIFKSDKITPFKAEQKTSSAKFHPSLTMNRAPRFINHLRDTLTSKTDALQFLLPKKEEDIFGKEVKEAVEKEEAKGPEQLALKKSAETRADIYGSNTMTLTDCRSKEDLLQNHQFHSAQEIPLERHQDKAMQKSELLQFRPRGEKHSKLSHKLTNKEMFSCFTPQPHRNNEGFHPMEKWDMNCFLEPQQSKHSGDLDRLEEHAIENELDSLFEKNNWQQKIGGLFTDDEEMKRSFHEGGEPQWRKENDKQLTLLKNFGKTVFQSSLQEERT